MVDLKFTKKDQVIFDQFLRMPMDYFRLVRNLYPKGLAAVPYNLPKIITTYHKLKGRGMLKDPAALKLIHGGIPPQYVTTIPEVTAKKEILDTLQSLLGNFDNFMKSGVTLYVYSPFESSALSASVKLCVKASLTNVSWRMMPYPRLVEMIKDFDGGHGDTLESLATVDLLSLYMVGKEYPTEFTMSYFRQLLENRKVAKKVTIISSHLTPVEFAERYGSGISTCPMQFTDDAELDNFKNLRRLVEG